jgi:rRNA maturation RNase YbeY
LGIEGARVSVTVCGDARIRALNRAHPGLDRATDALAFPQEPQREGRFVRRSPAADAWRAGGGGPQLDLGDVVVSRDAVARQAREDGGGRREELARLLVHGVLHLLGWDHETPGERARMRRLENRLVVEVM